MNTRVLRFRIATWLAVLSSLCLFSHPSAAEPSAMDRAAAEALFEEAVALMDKGEAPPACPKLEESQRLDPAVGTLLYLGACYEKLGRSASAWATFTEAAYAAKDAGQGDRELIASQNAARLKPLLARLVVDVAARDTAGLSVSSDGKPLSQAMWGSEIPVDPGTRQVTATAPGKQPWAGSVEVPAQGVVRLTVPELLDAAPELPVGPAEHEPPPTALEPSRRPPHREDEPGASQRLWGWIGIGAGSAVLLGGGVFAFLSVADNGRADDACRRDDPTSCSERGVELGDSAQTKADIASVLGGVGAAVAVTGAILLFTAPDGSEQARLSLAPGWAANSGAVRFEGSF